MRSRLLTAFLGLTVLILLLYAVPRALILAEQTRAQEHGDVARTAAALYRVIQADLRAGELVRAEDLEPAAGELDSVVYRAADGTEVHAGPQLRPDDVGIEVELSVDGGGVLTVQRPDVVVNQRVQEALLPIVLVGLAVLVVAVLAAVVLSRRLARPFVELAAAADRLGEGTFDLSVPEQRLPEAQAIARSLLRSRDRLENLVNRERAFASNASHQLRTPLTALRLQLEDLEQWPEVNDSVRKELGAALAEIDRLSGTVSGLLDMARLGALGEVEAVYLDEVARAAAMRWQPLVGAAGRALDVQVSGPVPVQEPPGALHQVLDVLIENALNHGQGSILLTVDLLDEQGRLRVQDEGPGIPLDVAGPLFLRGTRGESSQGEGIGLALADEIVHRLGGRLSTSPKAPTTFTILLPIRAQNGHAP